MANSLKIILKVLGWMFFAFYIWWHYFLTFYSDLIPKEWSPCFNFDCFYWEVISCLILSLFFYRLKFIHVLNDRLDDFFFNLDKKPALMWFVNFLLIVLLFVIFKIILANFK